ncbi:hypothetical protein [Pseudomonas piscis]|uniref:Uncharacterized protein n=1 Tax=Pseudomonas piscis TaxID=2614538 RepID=A0A7X1PMK3_9PSED|nr:hypothetical protein [Pseudomonas piscis]MQA54949.1 hypothetical protein [Pseudomonas piscis]
MNKALYSLCATTLALSLDAAHAASVAEVFTGDMLGTNQRYFESIAGIPRESNGNAHVFKVQGCQITATVEGGKVSALRMELGPKCQADLTQFVGTYAPAPGQPLTLGAFEASSGGGLSYSADCLSMCGNAADPSVYALWEGPHAVDFKQVMLEVTLVSDAAINAADQWASQMQKAEGEDYVMETRFNCDQKYATAAQKAFEKVQVTAVTIGTDLKGPGC